MKMKNFRSLQEGEYQDKQRQKMKNLKVDDEVLIIGREQEGTFFVDGIDGNEVYLVDKDGDDLEVDLGDITYYDPKNFNR